VLDGDEGCAERHDHSLDLLVDVSRFPGVHLDLELADRARVQPGLLELLQQPVAVRNACGLDIDRIRHKAHLGKT
jgi:hypothetical protein